MFVRLGHWVTPKKGCQFGHDFHGGLDKCDFFKMTKTQTRPMRRPQILTNTGTGGGSQRGSWYGLYSSRTSRVWDTGHGSFHIEPLVRLRGP